MLHQLNFSDSKKSNDKIINNNDKILQPDQYIFNLFHLFDSWMWQIWQLKENFFFFLENPEQLTHLHMCRLRMGVKSLTGLPENFPHCYDLGRRLSTIKPLRSQRPGWVPPTCEGLSWLRSGKVWEIKTLLDCTETLCSDFDEAFVGRAAVKNKQLALFGEGKSICTETKKI